VTKKHILIVDDSPTDVQVLKQLLSEIGDFKISVAEDGDEGIKKAEELLPDLILMDVVMPNLNGFRATRILTHNDVTSHIPVLIVTTKEQVSDNIWAIRQGACGFMNKPVDKDVLQELVLEAIS
jgi:twitching motility two-component system response regulator PilH